MRQTPPTPDSFLPLRPIEALILTMLAAGARHGYGLRRDIIDHTDGAIVLEAGSLYRYIRGFEEDGLVVEAGRRPAADADDERRRYYELTALGRKVVVAEMMRLRALIEFAEEHRVIRRAPA
jgi:DNA-binding PadR family transcriptional regulator